MPMRPSLPAYEFRVDLPNLMEMGTKGISDVAAVIPQSILSERMVQLPSPPLGPKAPFIVADPDLAREVLLDREGKFGRDVLMKRLMRRSWGRGLAAAEGEDWKRQRKAVVPMFRTSAVAKHAPSFARAAREVMRDWEDEEIVDLSDVAGRIIARVVFHVLIEAGHDVDPDAVAREMPRYMDRIAGFDLLDLLPLPERVHDRMRGLHRDPSVRRLGTIASEIAAGEIDRETIDFPSAIAAAGPVEDNVRGLFPAAMDTTTKALIWSLLALAHNPTWQERVAMEAKGCTNQYSMESLPITRRVVQEALRLFPPAPMLVRSAVGKTVLGDKPLLQGQTVAVSIYAMHRHRKLWADPDIFDPDRWLRGSSDNPAYMPFGYGPRVCVAAQFAMLEVMTVVAEIACQRSLEPHGDLPRVGLQITTHPVSAAKVKAGLREVKVEAD